MTDKTNNLTARADQITVEGGLSAFEKEFRDMEAKLREVETILNGTDVTPVDLQEIRDKIDQLRYMSVHTQYCIT